MIKHWITPDWPASANVNAATTLRTGGVSTLGFSSLNLAAHTGDRKARVMENRRRITAMLNLPAEPAWMKQVHGHRVVNADLLNREAQADASYSEKAGVVCVIQSADCLPILLCNKQGTHIAAIHAGWRSLLSGVVQNTVQALQSDQLLAWMGPAIGPDQFEVGNEVRIAFLNKNIAFESAFQELNHGKWLADLYQIARIILAEAGIHSVFGGGFCTFKESDRFYSYRRDGNTGRMATFIWRD